LKQSLISGTVTSSANTYPPGGYTGSIYSNSGYTTITPVPNSAITFEKIYDNNSSNRSLVINGRDVMQELDEMRDVLVLLNRDVSMEEKYPKLKELKDAYNRQLLIY